MARTIRLVSPAKLNLYLEVLRKRKDGYHDICTVFERISLADRVIIRESFHGGITVRSDFREIPQGRANIAYKAASMLKRDFHIKRSVDIEIRKVIPVGAGLGGGSSNAASVLLGLDRLWNLKLKRAKLLRYAGRLGSDVAFFLYECPFAVGTSRGNKISPLDGLKQKIWHIVVVPNKNISTKIIYNRLDKISGKSGFHRPQLHIAPGVVVADMLFNRLEEVTLKEYSAVRQVKERLKAVGLSRVLMSGSGSAVFAIVSSRKEGLRAARAFENFKKLKVFVVSTL